MNGFENWLAAAGLRLVRPAAECWRVERLGAPRQPRDMPLADPPQGGALSIWLDRLREPREPIVYRIHPARDSD